MENLQYPIGKFKEMPFSEKLKEEWLLDIKFLPGLVENAILNLNEEHFEMPYREGGWKIKTLVHHIADSHINAYLRIKKCITEENPLISTYDEKEWAKLNDVDILPVNISVTLLFALHSRMYHSLAKLPDKTWYRRFTHPDYGEKNLFFLLGQYAWHGKHHVAHITNWRKKMSLGNF